MTIAQFYGARQIEAEPASLNRHKTLLATDFHDVAELAREISGAGAACIRLAGESVGHVRFYPERPGDADLSEALFRSERDDHDAVALEASGFAGMQFWAGFPLRGPSDEVIGLLGVMDEAPRALSQRALKQLQMLADILANKVRLAASTTETFARRMQRLVEDVSEVDDAAASPALRGLLRFAAGDAPNSTEAMALRIAGLAEPKGGKLVLTQMAEGILAYHFTGGGTLTTELPEPVVAEAGDVPVHEFTPMARLRIGEESHDIARSEGMDCLAFRTSGHEGTWLLLDNGLEEGWPEIIAEVLRKTRDVVMDYVRMHMIHTRDAGLPEGQYHYDLYGMGWTVRGTPDHAEVSVDGADWLAFDAGSVGWDQPRDLAARAAMAGYPHIGERIGADVHDWCKRIAAGSEVTPIF